MRSLLCVGANVEDRIVSIKRDGESFTTVFPSTDFDGVETPWIVLFVLQLKISCRNLSRSSLDLNPTPNNSSPTINSANSSDCCTILIEEIQLLKTYCRVLKKSIKNQTWLSCDRETIRKPVFWSSIWVLNIAKEDTPLSFETQP